MVTYEQEDTPSLGTPLTVAVTEPQCSVVLYSPPIDESPLAGLAWINDVPVF